MNRKIIVEEYEIPIQGEYPLELPAGSKIIKVGQDFNHTDKLRLWARIPKRKNGVLDKYTIYIIETGILSEVNPFAEHLETVITKNKVWHVYYVNTIRNDFDNMIGE